MRRYLRGLQTGDFVHRQTFPTMLRTSIVVFAAVIVTVSSLPPNIGKGNYVYDPNSISQNEKILELFVRLAAHTANRLIRLKTESNPDSIGLKVGKPKKTVSSISEEAKDTREESAVRVPGLRSSHEGRMEKDSDLGAGDNSAGKSFQEIPDDKTEPGVETTTEVRVELMEDDDMGVGDESENTGTEVPRESAGDRYPADEGVEDISDHSDQPLIRDEMTTSIDDETATPASEVEVANRALFSFAKNNYVTHYTDQSVNTNRAETTIHNHGVSHPGSVVVNQLAGSSGSFGSKSVDQSRKADQAKTVVESGSGSKYGGVVVNQVAGKSGSSEIGQSIEHNNAITMIGNSGSRYNSALQGNQQGMQKISAGGTAAGQFAASSFKLGLGLAHAGASIALAGSKEIRGSDKSRVELRKEAAAHRSESDALRESKMRQESIAEDKRQQESKGFHSSLGVRMGEVDGSAAGVVHEAQIHRAAEFTQSGHSSSSDSSSKQTQQAFGSAFNVGGRTDVDTKHVNEAQIRNAIDFAKSARFSSSGSSSKETQQAFGSALNTGGQISADLQHSIEAQIHNAKDLGKSARSSSSAILSKETEQTYGSGLNVGGQIGINLQHGMQASNSENLQSSSLEHAHRSISAAAKVQAGHSTVKIEAGQGLSAGIGLLNAKMNLVRGAIKSKGNFDGKLNLSAHVSGS